MKNMPCSVTGDMVEEYLQKRWVNCGLGKNELLRQETARDYALK